MLLLAVYVGAADKWGAYSDPFPIRDVVPYGEDGVLLATDGGVRYRLPEGDWVYHSEHGLETSRIYSIVKTSLGYFAISEYGMIIVLGDGENPWRVLNRSYVKNNVRAVPHGTVYGNGILVIAFEDRLAFFDLIKGRSMQTLDRVGNTMLSASPVQQMVVHGDSLYVKMENALYVRQMDWENLSDDRLLGVPSSWKSLSTKTLVEGLESPDESQVVVNGTVLKDSVLYDNNGKSRIKWQVASQGGTYLVGSECIFYLADGQKTVKDLTEYKTFPLGETYELRATPVGSGGVLAASVDGKMSYGNLQGWREPNYVYGTQGNDVNAYSARMKVLSYLPDGHVFYHVWGFSYILFSQWGEKKEQWFRGTDDYCFDKYLEGYPISFSTIPAPDNSGFLTSTGNLTKGYSVVYFTKEGDVVCAKQVGANTVPGAMYATIDTDGSWLVYVTSKTGTSLAASGGLDVIRFTPPKSNGGMLEPIGKVKTYQGIPASPVDMVYDSVGKKLWLVSMSGIAYLDEEQEALVLPSSTNGLLGAEYTSIDVDVHGNLWVGTSNQGVYRLTPKNGSPDTLQEQHFTTKDGLLDNNVSDVAIDHVLGIAWFAHEKGVSYYQRNDLRDARKNMTDSAKVKVYGYPIPFRPKIHSRFTIDGVSEKSVVSIFNRGGALMKSFSKDEVLGGKAEWNGRDKKGNLVAPGVYYYVVRDGSKVHKGKFIVVH